jgi:hypothetical protein
MPEEMKQAPTQVRKVFELIADTELEMPKALLVTKIPGIDIELFPTPPISKRVPILVTLSSCILRDIQMSRTGVKSKGEIRLFFSVGISWDTTVWRWAGDMVFMECFAKFHQSQSQFFDDHPADEEIEPVQLTPEQADTLSLELGSAQQRAPKRRQSTL